MRQIPIDDVFGHPRPLLRRPAELLDGRWGFALDADAKHERPGSVVFDREIEVPFAPETPASGVGESWVPRCWYRNAVSVRTPGDGRLLLHFEGVDREADVWADGEHVAHHEGGYTRWTVDVTDHAADGVLDLVVRAEDDPAALDVPRGKQDWLREPHSIWYPRTTGIWKAVWLERVPECRIGGVDVISDLTARTVTATVTVDSGAVNTDRVRAAARFSIGDFLLGEATATVIDGSADLTVALRRGGIDADARLVWWPRRPQVLDVEVALVDSRGDAIDEVRTYTALRSVSVEDGRFLLNGRPYPLRLVLDQGYWPESGATAPSTEAIARDIELTRALGFNGARKHQKIEDERYLARADHEGLLVWVEMPSAYRPTPAAAQRLIAEWTDVVAMYRGHPSVVAWVPINESWGVPDVATDERQRALVRALAEATHALDGTRPVSPNDGWETTGGEIVGVHDYDQDANQLQRRYGSSDALAELFHSRRPDGRLVDVDRSPQNGRAVVLSEFGGVALSDDPGSWGYTTASSPDDLVRRYRELWAAVHECPALSGACWTQLTDTYQEANGLLRPDRTPKADLEELARATRGG